MAEYTDLDQALANPQDVTHLYLIGNELRKLPSKIGQLTNLTHLDLGGNEDLDWSDAFKKLASLTKLTSLCLGGNHLNDEEIEWIQKQLPDCEIDCSGQEYYEGVRE